MVVVAESSRGLRFGASLLVMGAALMVGSCASSDSTFDGPGGTPTTDGGADAHKDGPSEASQLCASNCPAPSDPGMVACCTQDNKCGVMPQGGSTCIANVPDSGAAGGGGMGGMGP